MKGLLTRVAPKPAWSIAGRPVLSFRRLISLLYFRLKRRAGRDYSFTPPAKSSTPIDIYMPVIEKDADMLDLAITYARQNIQHPIKNIYIVAPASSQLLKRIAKKHDCTFVSEESVLGFNKDSINYKVDNVNRNGWIYKMLINLAADTVAESRYILILDADTCFIAPQIFLYKDRPLFNLSNEYHQPYFDATERLIGMKHYLSRSFITHYMLFDAKVLQSLRDDIEKQWNKPWHQAIIDNIDKKEVSGFADYEIYGDYYLRKGSRRPILNYWSNESLTLDAFADLDSVIDSLKLSFRSVSLHNYKASFIKTKKEGDA